MKFVLLTSVISLLISELQLLNVYGQLQEAVTTEHQLHHHNGHRHHQRILQQENEHYLHHTRHHQHHQQNLDDNHKSGKHYHLNNIKSSTTATIKPATISHNIKVTKNTRHYQEQTTTSSPAFSNNANNKHQHNRQQHHQQEFRAHHHHHARHQHHQNHHHHRENQNYLLRQGMNDDNEMKKTIQSGEILRHNLDAIQQNRIDEQENYYVDNDDYSYRDDNDESAGDAYDFNYNEQEYARVTRDHSHGNHQANFNRHNDLDYANDEPSHSNNEQMPSLMNETRKGAITAQKYSELGTPENAQKAREKYLQEQQRLRTPNLLFRDHLRRMSTAARCRHPMPRVVSVSNETSKTYMPRCTILHRCGEDTGCCESTSKVCTVKTYEEVELYFNVENFAGEKNLVTLMLLNHTECHCVDRSKLFDSAQRRDKRSGLDAEQTDASSEAICRCPKHYDVLHEEEHSTMEPFGQTLEHQLSNGGPSFGLLPAVLSSNINTCHCDCLSTNIPCQRLKNGEEGFSIGDRNCVSSQSCKLPKCRFGSYNLQTGRCPRLRNHQRAETHNDNGYG